MWHFYDNDKNSEATTLEQMQALLLSGEVKADTPVWRPGMDTWQPASDTELAQYVPKATALTTSQVDARPILARSADTIWERLRETQAQIYQAFKEAATAEGLRCLELRSNPFVQPAWVKFEAWIPQPDPSLTERVKATVTIEPMPCHKYEFVHHLKIDRRGKIKTHNQLREFSVEDAATLIRHLVQEKPHALTGLKKLRQYSWQIWLPKNKVKMLKFDMYRLLPTGLFLGGLVVFPLFWLFWPAAVYAWWWSEFRRPCFVRSTGKPASEPRNLRRADSWQTLIFGAGNEWETLRDRLLEVFEDSPVANQRCQSERIWYWGLDGTEERDQIVLTSGRGIVFVHVYEYGSDIYVGWDGHLNMGQWVEKRLLKGVERNTGQLVNIETVVPGVQVGNEYDVIDLSCLMEWVHTQATQSIRTFIKEREIDQEIDFSIVRESRQELTRQRDSSTESTRKKLVSRFRRAG